MTHFFLSVNKAKNWVILTWKFGSNLSSDSDSIFLGQNDSFFLSVHEAKKIELFLLKNLSQI